MRTGQDLDQMLARASSFMATHARLLDHRRFELITGRGRADDVLSAVLAYRNADGGFGWALEPDLRSRSSQPAGAMHALEALAEAGPTASDAAVRLCDWLASITLPDGGLPFALPFEDVAGSAPWWVKAARDESSLQMTSQVADMAHRVARHDAAVREHEWLATATAYTLRRITEVDASSHALELRFALGFLNTVHDLSPRAPAELERLAALVPDSGVLPVEGGIEGEALHVLDLSPLPGPLRAHLAPEAITTDLARLAARQQDDGGWTVNFGSQSPAGALDWRGYATAEAAKILLAHSD